MYMVATAAAGAPPALPALYLFLSTSGTSTSSTTACSSARRSPSAAVFWKGGDAAHRRHAGRGRRPALRIARGAGRIQTGYTSTTPLP